MHKLRDLRKLTSDQHLLARRQERPEQVDAVEDKCRRTARNSRRARDVADDCFECVSDNPICIDVPSTECVRVRLKTNPADVNSSLYDKYIIPLSSEHTHAEAFLEFSLSLKQLFRGQNVVSGPMMYRIVRDLDSRGD